MNYDPYEEAATLFWLTLGGMIVMTALIILSDYL